MSQWLIMLIPYFGRWPAWIEFFIESCKWNPDVRWRFFTDCGEPENTAENVDFVHLSFDAYKALVRGRLGVAFDPADPYKLCDLRPCLAYIHESDVAGFRFVGYGDVDVIYGRIRDFYSDDVIARANVLSTHPERLAGHFAVLRNSPVFTTAFKRIAGYRELLERPGYSAMDEQHFTEVFSSSHVWPRAIRRVIDRLNPRHRGLVFVERYSTVLSPRGWHDGTMEYPRRWCWRNGRLTNDRDGERAFLYLHFMRWQSERWASDPPAREEGAWRRLDRIVQLDWRRAGTQGFCISAQGITEPGPPPGQD